MAGTFGGKQEGAGRPKGSKSEATLTKEAAQKAYDARTIALMQKLQTAQASLASGQQFLYKIITEIDSKGKKTRSKPIRVEDPDEIAMYIDGTYGDGESPNTETEYYFITTKEPSSMAIDSMLNRTLGKPIEQVEHKGDIKVIIDF